MPSQSAAGPEDLQVLSVIPILRMYDVAATIRFYVDYLGCSLDHQDGEGDRPVYLGVSRDGMEFHLSSHHDDGTPGTDVLVVVRNIDACTPNFTSVSTRSSIRASARVPGTAGRCSSSTLLPTGSASTSQLRPARLRAR